MTEATSTMLTSVPLINMSSAGTLDVSVDGHFNITALLQALQRLTSGEKQLLLSQLGFHSEQQLYELIDHVEPRSHEDQLMEYMEYQLHKVLLLYMPPILLIIGTIGNMLSFCVLLRKDMRRTSTYNYLAVLSFTDMLVLYVGLLRLWLGEVTGVDIRDESDWSCKFISMAGYTVSVYSVWLLIAVTVERYIVTVHSLRASTMCTQSRAVKTIVLILLILLSINLHFLWTTQLRVQGREGAHAAETCHSAAGYEHLVEQIWPWIDACLYSILPFVVICILNSLIVQKVIIARRSRRFLSGGGNGASSAGSITRSASESSARVTIMLLTISFTFLLCTLPMNVTMIHRAVRGFDALSLQDAARYRLSRTVSELLMYTNHSINFYLYLLTGNKFRQQLLTMLCPCKQQLHAHSTNYSVVTQEARLSCKPGLGDTEMSVIKNGSGGGGGAFTHYTQLSDDTE